MRLSRTKNKNSETWYVIKDNYLAGHRTTVTVETLGSREELEKKHPDALAWAKEYIRQLTLEDKKKRDTKPVTLNFEPNRLMPLDDARLSSIGYLFLQSIYTQLRLPQITSEITKNLKIDYDLNEILEHLICTRILSPGSKESTFKASQRYLEEIHFDQHQIYRALDVLAENSDLIQKKVYHSSHQLVKRDSQVLYYDCTNYFFEIENEKGLKQYGTSKEHRPNPIIQMGLFMDASGFPLAFDLTRGKQNEQVTMRPLEKKILKDFDEAQLIICTDAGLASNANKKFNDQANRFFVTAHSLKKMKASQREVLMDPRGWKRMGSRKTFNLDELGPEDEQTTFYKESEWLNEEGIHQRFLVTYSLKYKYYLQSIRAHQIHREDKKIKTYSQFNKKGPHDPKRFVKEVRVTESGEVADKIHLGLDQERIDHEAKFDGFYCISTDYECSPEMLIKIIARRQKIEETFRIMKDEMKARPVYLQRDNRIKAHFLTCFLAMLVYRILEDKLHHQYTVDEIIQTLKEMNVLNQKDLGYQPCYTRTRLTDSLHEAFGFRTDWEFITGKRMKEIIKKSHNPK